MPIMLYPKCWRDRNDCQPIHCIDGVNHELTEEQMMTLDYEPESFVCSGVAADPALQRDQYRLCFKNPFTDEMSDNDIQDLTSIISVAAAALNLDAVRKVNTGVLEIPLEHAKGG